MSSRLSGPRILQKREELDGLQEGREEGFGADQRASSAPDVYSNAAVPFEYIPFGAYPVVLSPPLSGTSPLAGPDGTPVDSAEATSTGIDFLSGLSESEGGRAERMSRDEEAVNEFFARADSSRYPQGSRGLYYDASQSREDDISGDNTLTDETRKRLQLNALIDTKAPYNIYNPHLSIDQLLAEFLKTADVGDSHMTNIVKRGLHEVLLMEFGSETLVLESLRLLLAREDYLRCAYAHSYFPEESVCLSFDYSNL